MACSGCAQRRAQLARFFVAARERNGSTALNATREFFRTYQQPRDTAAEVRRPPPSFYRNMYGKPVGR